MRKAWAAGLLLAFMGAALAGDGLAIEEEGSCRPLELSDEQNIALFVTLRWGFEGIRHGGGYGRNNSWHVTLYNGGDWMVSRGRVRLGDRADDAVKEVCVILRGTGAGYLTAADIASGKKPRLTP